jgi:hypothetical protein
MSKLNFSEEFMRRLADLAAIDDTAASAMGVQLHIP